MFDPRSLKRKLVNMIPGDARAQLQNVLTVEWDTHKTVLVEVPGAGSASQSSHDVEMEGLSLNRSNEREGYGRLEDDYEDHDAYNPNLAIDSSRSGRQSENHFNRPIPRPPPRQLSSSSDKRLPELPTQNRRQEELANNPFASEDDFAPGPSSGFLQPKREEGSSRSRSRTIEEGWNTFSNPYGTEGRAEARGENSRDRDPWGKGKEPNSPSSSRGTRDSAQTSVEENPFR